MMAEGSVASSPENEPLSALVGTWKTVGEVVGGDNPAAIEATDTYKWQPGGFCIVHYVDSRIGHEEIKGVELIGWDESRRAFFVPFFDSQGSVGFEELRVDGEKWTWQGENVFGVPHHRCIAVFSEDGNTLDGRHERSNDGENLVPWMNVVLTRQE
jgi:hypothetical protein